MNGRPHKPPLTLRTIAFFEAAKGALAFAAGCGLVSLRHTDLHAATDAFLLKHGIDPETHYRRLCIESVARITHQHEAQIAAVLFAYALIRVAEAYGLPAREGGRQETASTPAFAPAAGHPPQLRFPQG